MNGIINENPLSIFKEYDFYKTQLLEADYILDIYLVNFFIRLNLDVILLSTLSWSNPTFLFFSYHTNRVFYETTSCRVSGAANNISELQKIAVFQSDRLCYGYMIS